MSRAFVFGLLASCLVAWAPFSTAAPAARPQGDPESRRSGPAPMPELVKRLAEKVERLQGNGARWDFVFDGVAMILVTDDEADRMRIMAPVADATVLRAQQLFVLMEANFDRALDAKYAIFQGSVWATFVHPASGLSDAELSSGLSQVAALVKNYGTTFSSTGLVFTPEAPPGESEGTTASPP